MSRKAISRSWHLARVRPCWTAGMLKSPTAFTVLRRSCGLWVRDQHLQNTSNTKEQPPPHDNHHHRHHQRRDKHFYHDGNNAHEEDAHLPKRVCECYPRRDVETAKHGEPKVSCRRKNFLATPARKRSQGTHQQSLSLPALHTNTQFRMQVCSRLRKAGQTSATPKNMSGSDVEAKQTGRSAAWHKGARDFAQEFQLT